MRKKIIYLSALTLIVLNSCKKEDSQATTETTCAMLQWTGDYAIDGCGYRLFVNMDEHKITNEDIIPEKYKTANSNKSSVQVKLLNYHRKEIKPCQLPVELNAVKILEIL
jgi:hypothetical protein